MNIFQYLFCSNKKISEFYFIFSNSVGEIWFVKLIFSAPINDGKVVGHLPLGKSGKIEKSFFYFLKADKKHSCRNNVLWKVISALGGLEMIVPCQLLLFANGKYINALKENSCYAVI